jgi:hypothetical protein
MMAEPETLQMKLDFLGKVLEALPAGNKIILEHLMEFLYTVSLHKTNCMSIPNIAIVFAPNLMRPKVERIEAILTNSSSVNMIISLLIQHHEVLFHGKEFQDDENATEVVLSPQLISLKMAQSLHGKTGPGIQTAATEGTGAPSALPPVSPRGEKPRSETVSSGTTVGNSGDSSPHSTLTPGAKKSTRKVGEKPMKRSQTVSSPSTSADTKKPKIKREKSGTAPEEFSEFTTEDLDNAAMALEGGGGRQMKRKKSRKNNSAKDDQFFDTLKKGTMRLAANLLEEQELVLEMAELEGLTTEEKEALQAKVVKKVTESKSLRDHTRKQRQVQRTQTSNFSKLREMSSGPSGKGHKRSTSSNVGEKSSLSSSGGGGADSDVTGVPFAKKAGTSRGHKSKKSNGGLVGEGSTASLPLDSIQHSASGSIDSPSSAPDSETSSAVDNGELAAAAAEIELDPAIAQFEEELDRQLSLEDEGALAHMLESSSSDSDDSDEPFDYAFLSASLPPPLAVSSGSLARASALAANSLPPPIVSGDAAWAGASVGQQQESDEEERVVEAVMEGDMQQFQQYLGDMKRKKRLERTKSNKKILSRMSLSMSSSPITSASSSAPNHS